MAKCLIKSCKLKAERHHIKTRKSGGSDHAKNILNLCRKHHIEIHLSNVKMSKKYPEIKEALISKGWEFCDMMKSWVNYSKSIKRTIKKQCKNQAVDKSK